MGAGNEKISWKLESLLGQVGVEGLYKEVYSWGLNSHLFTFLSFLYKSTILEMASKGEKSGRELQLEGYIRDRDNTIRALWERIEEKEERIWVLTDMLRNFQVDNNELRMLQGRRPRYP